MHNTDQRASSDNGGERASTWIDCLGSGPQIPLGNRELALDQKSPSRLFSSSYAQILHHMHCFSQIIIIRRVYFPIPYTYISSQSISRGYFLFSLHEMLVSNFPNAESIPSFSLLFHPPFQHAHSQNLFWPMP